MSSVEVSVRPATRRDLAHLAGVMARAFVDDPVFAWMLPSSVVRERRLPRFFSNTLRQEAASFGATEVACAGQTIVGGAIWYPPPGRYVPSVASQLRMLPGYLAVFGRRLGIGQTYVVAALAAHPREPHWYLGFVGVEPTLHGQGIGSKLVRSRLLRCDAGAEHAYLESSNPKNLALYERLGFQSTGQLPLPAGAPEVTTMWRPPEAGPVAG